MKESPVVEQQSPSSLGSMVQRAGTSSETVGVSLDGSTYVSDTRINYAQGSGQAELSTVDGAGGGGHIGPKIASHLAYLMSPIVCKINVVKVNTGFEDDVHSL
ncbi:unnamed protein product [Pleuronectes platessa]|uniref:Uncharacterized protein n=1 Tax=Pleuronectes platessa TaxID=8262 RepID=A0A9N7UVJ8_PLEPL|nr:unnamed protein product [Pleuronectes platessa]